MDIRDREDLIREELLVGFEVRDSDPGQIVGSAKKSVQFEDFIEPRQSSLECLDAVPIKGCQLDLEQHFEPLTEQSGRDLSLVSEDHAVRFELLHTPQTGPRCEAHSIGQGTVWNTSIPTEDIYYCSVQIIHTPSLHMMSTV